MILQADREDNVWTRHVIREADIILLLADATDRPHEVILPGRLVSPRQGSFDRRELVLVQPDGLSLPRDTRRWLDRMHVDGHYHVRLGKTADMARIGRMLAGRGHGLALGGGASRGFAHIGAIRELIKARIPIDIVCGTSMGSIVAAQVACGWSPQKMQEESRRYLVDSSPFDFTMPLVAATRGHKFEHMLEAFFGNAQLEDLWIRCGTVSASLVHANVVPHFKGSVAHAVRASCALPGLLPPLVVENDILVDGVFLENLPVRVTRQMGAGRLIAVNVLSGTTSAMNSSFASLTEKHGFLRQVGNMINPFAGPRPPPIIDFTMQGFFLGAHHTSAQAKEEVDLFIEPDTNQFWFLDFSILDAAIAEGEIAARKALDSCPWRSDFAAEVS